MSDDAPDLPPVDPADASLAPGSLTPELLASLLVEGDDELVAWALGHELAERPRAEVYDGLVADAMNLIGQRWETGRWSIAEEHIASRTLLRALERVRPDLGPEGRVGPLAVLAAVAGEHHALGLACLSQVLAERGWTVVDLGPDMPAADLATYVERNEPALVALAAKHGDRLETLVEAITAVRAARPDVPIAIGGAIAGRPGLAATLGIDWAGTSLVEAAKFADRVAPEMTSPA